MRYVSVQLVHKDTIFANLVEARFYKSNDDWPHRGRLWRQAKWDTEDNNLADQLVKMQDQRQDIEVVVSVFEDADLVKHVRLPFNAKDLRHSWSCGSNQPETWHFIIDGFIDEETVAALEG